MNLAQCHLKSGSLQKCAWVLLDALQLLLVLYGEQHVYTIDALMQLAMVQHQSAHYDQAIIYYRRASRILSQQKSTDLSIFIH